MAEPRCIARRWTWSRRIKPLVPNHGSLESRSCAMAYQQRSLADLLNKEEPAWPLVQSWMKDGKNSVEVLPATEPQRSDALVSIQVTTRSPMGAVIYETGGLLVDHGWIRVLGSGHPQLPRSLPDWNWGRSIVEEGIPPPFLLVADDVVGGFFALNGGAIGDELQ